MARHIVKYEYQDGEKLDVPIVWCGSKTANRYFVDAQHAALAKEQGSLIQPCKRCCKAIIKALEWEACEDRYTAITPFGR